MKNFVSNPLDENLYHEKLDNGMDIYVLHKEKFYKTVANVTIRFGSIDTHILNEKKEKINIPIGTAHFLEHQMFENNSKDGFSNFSYNGSKINAFTNFKYTSYSISTTDNILENITNLINLCQSLDISNGHLEKEKNIIAQEINLYNDNPDWIGRYTLLQSLFRTNSIKHNIAGDLDSLKLITKGTLEMCYRYFYNPSNMKVFIATSLTPEIVLNKIKGIQKNVEPIVFNQSFVDNDNIIIDNKEIYLNVTIPKIYIGFKIPSKFLQCNTFQNELILDIFFEALFSQRSKEYQQMISESLISTPVNWSISLEKEFGFIIINFDTKEPKKAREKIVNLIKNAKDFGIPDMQLNFTKRKKIGEYLSKFNSLDYISNKFSQYIFKNEDILSVIKIIKDIDTHDINTLPLKWLKKENMSTLLINKNNE